MNFRAAKANTPAVAALSSFSINVNFTLNGDD